MGWLPALLAIFAIGAILLTTPAGRRLRARLRSGPSQPGSGWGSGVRARAPGEDHDFLLRACGGDADELGRRLEAEIRRNPHQSEAQLYRRAIRRVMQERGEAE